MKDFTPPKDSQFGSVSALAKKLGLEECRLRYIAENSEQYWVKGKTIDKEDGKKRLTNNAKPELKGIHQTIKEKILIPTIYPNFLHGALPKRSVFSNARSHTKKRVLISEDIANFFPSTSEKIILRIWQIFFNCPPEVALVLTQLTTHKGMLPQGWKTSSYLANLVFWDKELKLYNELASRGFTYSRFVDDISVSCRRNYTKSELTWVIKKIHCMFANTGYRLKRTKHDIRTSSSRQLVNNQLVNNSQVGVTRNIRRRIRAGVFQLGFEYNLGAGGSSIYPKKWRKLASEVGKLKAGHPLQYRQLRTKLNAIKPTM